MFMNRQIKGYTDGWITALELSSSVLAYVDKGNASTILPLLPDEVIIDLRQRLEESPHTDEGWSQLKLLSFVDSTIIPSVPEYRATIEFFRDYFNRTRKKGGTS
jgi:hypothetical protein